VGAHRCRVARAAFFAIGPEWWWALRGEFPRRFERYLKRVSRASTEIILCVPLAFLEAVRSDFAFCEDSVII